MIADSGKIKLKTFPAPRGLIEEGQKLMSRIYVEQLEHENERLLDCNENLSSAILRLFFVGLFLGTAAGWIAAGFFKSLTGI